MLVEQQEPRFLESRHAELARDPLSQAGVGMGLKLKGEGFLEVTEIVPYGPVHQCGKINHIFCRKSNSHWSDRLRPSWSEDQRMAESFEQFLALIGRNPSVVEGRP